MISLKFLSWTSRLGSFWFLSVLLLKIINPDGLPKELIGELANYCTLHSWYGDNRRKSKSSERIQFAALNLKLLITFMEFHWGFNEVNRTIGVHWWLLPKTLTIRTQGNHAKLFGLCPNLQISQFAESIEAKYRLPEISRPNLADLILNWTISSGNPSSCFFDDRKRSQTAFN